MPTNSNADSVVEWYMKNRPVYEALANKAGTTTEELLRAAGVNYHRVTVRAKDPESFREKIARKAYRDPANDIKDLAGVRITCYVESDVRNACALVEEHFNVEVDHSLDKSQDLGTDRMGYRSMHYVVKFGAPRSDLPEYRPFREMPFEIQVRTILQEAWAEIEHDRNYKFRGLLPDTVRRRFSVLAGVLEMADREFDAISQEIDRYAAAVGEEAARGKLGAEINSTSLRQYLLSRLEPWFAEGFQPSFGKGEDPSDVVVEMQGFGLRTLADVDRLIDQTLGSIDPNYVRSSNFTGLLRDLMIVSDWRKYFDEAWQHAWSGTDQESVTMWQEHGVPVGDLLREYDIVVLD